MKKQSVFLSVLIALVSLFIYGCSGGGSSEGSVPDISSSTLPENTVPLLVIALQYSDIHFSNPPANWSDRIFGSNEHQLNHYFYEVSGGRFGYERAIENEGNINDGVITITLDKPHPDPESDNWQSIHPDLKNAVEIADEYTDFTLYDRDHNGILTSDEFQVIFIVAGFEDSYNGGLEAPGVWAHSDCTDATNTPLVDNVTLMGCGDGGNYSLFGERHYAAYETIPAHDATIGIIAHELSHATFHLLDLYDTTNNDSAGIGFFGLMGNGSWAQKDALDYPGNTPTHLSAWSKIRIGWIVPQIFSHVSSIMTELNATSSGGYNVVKIPINTDEYFLLENRHNSGYDRGLYSLDGSFEGGMALWHIDEKVILINTATNTVNGDATHKGVDIEEASIPVLDSGGLGNERNLYYAGNKTEFTPFTEPSSDAYTLSGSGIYIDNISLRGAVMSARITNPN